MKVVFYFALIMPFLVFGQKNGVRFEDNTSWAKIVAKAKAEHKYIFIDCFTTWCGPCKNMEKDVFSLKEVGHFMNSRYISIRLQMDSTKNDNENVRKQYAKAHSILKTFRINAFPSYLFLSPTAAAVHRGLGYKDKFSFLQMSQDALSPKSQYYTLLTDYYNRRIDKSGARKLAEMVNIFGEYVLAKQIADTYIQQLSGDEIYLRKNIEFYMEFVRRSTDQGFDVLYKDPQKVDKIMGASNYAQGLVDYIISYEEIDPKLWQPGYKVISDTPNWDQIRELISVKYDSGYANRTIVDAQIRWYGFRKEWARYCKVVIERVSKYGPFGTLNLKGWKLNANAWDLFLHSTDSSDLRIALMWSERCNSMISTPNLNYIDTYANLLYKLNRREEAIQWEEKAARLNPNDSDTKETLLKMKNGTQTWPNN